MTENAIRGRLVERGRALFDAPKQPIQFTRLPAADGLLNDLERYPHAIVIGCVMDRQVKAERAWLIPYAISEKLGGFSMEVLARLSRADLTTLMAEPEPLHRFVETMSGLLWLAVRRIDTQYAGDASRIWTGNLSSAEVV